ncbi:MAG: HD domain-containing protein [Actinobacteria bacterium]|nr:HD domain-containing protein [Actinomycetota bacterium]
MSDQQKPNWQPTGVIEEAFNIASHGHRDCVRKGTNTPYISHLLAVSALVIEHRGTEVQAAAALLHDVLEDTEIDEFFLRALIDRPVVDIVVACSDTQIFPKPPWRERKEKYLKHLREMIAEPEVNPAILVALADKVHNAETTADMALHKGKTAKEIYDDPNFNAKIDEQKWWYESLVNEFRKSEVAPDLVDRLDRAVKSIFN